MDLKNFSKPEAGRMGGALINHPIALIIPGMVPPPIRGRQEGVRWD